MEYKAVKNFLADLNGMVKENENLKEINKKRSENIAELKKELLELQNINENNKKQITDLKEKCRVMQAKMGGHCKAKENLKKQLEEKNPIAPKPKSPKKRDEAVSGYVLDALKFYDKQANLNEIYEAIVMKKPKWKFKANGKIEGVDLKKQIGCVLLDLLKKNLIIRYGSCNKYTYTKK